MVFTLASLYEVNPKFVEKPAFALKCKLNCSPVLAESNNWSHEAIKAFESIVGGAIGACPSAEKTFNIAFKVQVACEDGSLSYVVDLTDAEGKSVTEKLQETGFTLSHAELEKIAPEPEQATGET